MPFGGYFIQSGGQHHGTKRRRKCSSTVAVTAAGHCCIGAALVFGVGSRPGTLLLTTNTMVS